MNNEIGTAHREVLLTSEYGLHIRPAGLFARTATRFLSEIRVNHKGQTVNGKSTLDLLTLAAECGTALVIQAQGPDAELALETLCRLVESNFPPEAANPSSQAI